MRFQVCCVWSTGVCLESSQVSQPGSFTTACLRMSPSAAIALTRNELIFNRLISLPRKGTKDALDRCCPSRVSMVAHRKLEDELGA